MIPKSEAALTGRVEASQSPPLWATLTATVCGIGNLRPGPGTWGSAVTVVLWWLVARQIPARGQPFVVIGIALFVIAIGIPAATRVARATSSKDPQFIVIDEVAGQLIALIAAPLTWKCVLTAFILFRGFDILKPPPLKGLERLPDGSGIVMDDVGAGLYALAAMQLLLHFGILTHW
jgi:phosphatidylglycerophosphatase A